MPESLKPALRMRIAKRWTRWRVIEEANSDAKRDRAHYCSFDESWNAAVGRINEERERNSFHITYRYRRYEVEIYLGCTGLWCFTIPNCICGALEASRNSLMEARRVAAEHIDRAICTKEQVRRTLLRRFGTALQESVRRTKSLLLVPVFGLLFALCCWGFIDAGRHLTPYSVSVRGYYRSDGTYVRPYSRRPKGAVSRDSPYQTRRTLCVTGGLLTFGLTMTPLALCGLRVKEKLAEEAEKVRKTLDTSKVSS